MFSAPTVFFTACVIVGTATYFAVRATFRQQITNLNATLESVSARLQVLEAERNDYRDKLASITVTVGANTNDDAGRKIEEMTMRLSTLEEQASAQKVEPGSNANGTFERFSDGTQVCRGELDVNHPRRMFPAEFIAPPKVNIHPEGWTRVHTLGEGGFTFEVSVDRALPEGTNFVAVGAWRRENESR